MKLSPAEHVIQTFGGVRATARTLGRSASSVSKWRAHKSKRGTGGSVPGALHATILEVAKSRKLDISPADLILGRKTR